MLLTSNDTSGSVSYTRTHPYYPSPLSTTETMIYHELMAKCSMRRKIWLGDVWVHYFFEKSHMQKVSHWHPVLQLLIPPLSSLRKMKTLEEGRRMGGILFPTLRNLEKCRHRQGEPVSPVRAQESTWGWNRRGEPGSPRPRGPSPEPGTGPHLSPCLQGWLKN